MISYQSSPKKGQRKSSQDDDDDNFDDATEGEEEIELSTPRMQSRRKNPSISNPMMDYSDKKRSSATLTSNSSKEKKAKKSTTSVDYNSPDETPVEVVDVEKNTSSMEKKCPNFLPIEDELIARAWVHISEDARIGVGQKALTFWQRIHDHFVKLRKNKMPPEQWYERTPLSLSNRWKRPLSVDVKKWMAIWSQLEKEPHSGWNYDDYATECHKRFLARNGNKPFKFNYLLPILEDNPKFTSSVSLMYLRISLQHASHHPLF